MPRGSKHRDDESLGFTSYMKKFDKEKNHMARLERQRSILAQEADWDRALADDETVGYRNYMKKVWKQDDKIKKRVNKIVNKVVEDEIDHDRKHAAYASDTHNHTPRENRRGALEDGEEENVVICADEYRRLIDKISGILEGAIEMVQVVVSNESIVYGSRLHRFVDHTLTERLKELDTVDSLGNQEVARFKKYAVHQLQYTINQINTMFYKISQIKSEKPKRYKIQQDLLNSLGDTKYAKKKRELRPGLPVPPPDPFEFFVPGEGFVSPYRTNKDKMQHGKFYENELDKFTKDKTTGKKKLRVQELGNLRSLDDALEGSGEYFKKNPYIGHDHWSSLENLKIELPHGEKLRYPFDRKPIVDTFSFLKH